MRPQFAELDTGEIELRDGFGLDTLALEEQMVEHNGGFRLGDLFPFTIHNTSPYRGFVPYFGANSLKKAQRMRGVRGSPEGPCSMRVKSTKELAKHMGRVYQVSHYNYLLNKNKSSVFPRLFCSDASRAVMVSAFSMGYYNAAYARCEKNSHSYVILPFVLESEALRGVIASDPTSDQLWNGGGPRNAVFLKLGKKWEYVTHWMLGADLFPDIVCSIDVVRPKGGRARPKEIEHRNVDSYFDSAFANPVPVMS